MDHEQRFRQWWENRSESERALQGLAFEYEERHFGDMRLATPGIQRRLFTYRMERGDGVAQNVLTDGPLLGLDYWTWHYHQFRGGVYGDCNATHQRIRIKPGLDLRKHQSAVLHEMIHAYEGMLPRTFAEWLTLDLYRRMSKRIRPAQLQRLIDLSTHEFIHNAAHGALFLLKSLDIDSRKRWPWGTTFAYGRTDYFASAKGPFTVRSERARQ